MAREAPIPCHHVKIGNDEWVHIPGCWASLENPAFCTCYPTGSELEEAIEGRQIAEVHIERLLDKAHERTGRLNRMFYQNRKLSLRVSELERQLSDLTP